MRLAAAVVCTWEASGYLAPPGLRQSVKASQGQGPKGTALLSRFPQINIRWAWVFSGHILQGCQGTDQGLVLPSTVHLLRLQERRTHRSAPQSGFGYKVKLTPRVDSLTSGCSR